VFELHKKSLTFGYVDDSAFWALACLTPVHAQSSAWLMLWLHPDIRRKKRGYAFQVMLWQELHKLIFDSLGVTTLIAVSDKRSVIRLATRFGAEERQCIRHLYGRDKHGYIAVWETE
jgi:hypothetical protein